ncbi:hypothetical protein [Marinobacterium weihaiense]|uniref:Uncharacterized protein n=1 Tax=Marinobacterium weihaiense TaxID=2851016 RepID=A0ABS6M759_9GAMM|nr:hypothetical protein [Marinobacterium weihaiense]MBV0931744.1 hypothetical protein [Marinobacterium weihaiense]
MPRFFLVLLVASLLVISAATLTQDPDLSPDARSLLMLAEPSDQSRAFVYLMGFDTRLDHSPEVAGQKVLVREQLHEQQTENTTDIFQPALPNDGIPLPQGPAFCHFKTPGCLKSLFELHAIESSLTPAESELLSRWRRFHALRDYRVLTTASLEEPLPPYPHLVAAGRVSLRSIIRLAQNGQAHRARAAVLDDMQHMRQFLARESHMIGKMVAVSLLSDQIDLLNALQQHFQLSPAQPLAPLSLKEKSLRMAMAREFALLSNGLFTMSGQPDLLDSEHPMPAWLSRLLFKPGLTVNAALSVYQYPIAASEISPAEFVAFVTAKNRPGPQAHWVRNPLGTVLNRVATPDMWVYAARLHDLDSKIQLFNAINPPSPTAPGRHWINPYYPDDPTVALKPKARQICLKGPLEDSAGLRCLRGFALGDL